MHCCVHIQESTSPRRAEYCGSHSNNLFINVERGGSVYVLYQMWWTLLLHWRLVVWLVGLFWHINPCSLFNAKSCLYVYIYIYRERERAENCYLDVLVNTTDCLIFMIFKWRHSSLLAILRIFGSRWWRKNPYISPSAFDHCTGQPLG